MNNKGWIGTSCIESLCRSLCICIIHRMEWLCVENELWNWWFDAFMINVCLWIGALNYYAYVIELWISYWCVVYLRAIVCGEICLCLWIVMFCIIVCNRIMIVFLTLLLWFNAIMELQIRLLEFFLWSVHLHSFVGQLWYVTLGSRGDRFMMMYMFFWIVHVWLVLYRQLCLYMRYSVMWFSALIP